MADKVIVKRHVRRRARKFIFGRKLRDVPVEQEKPRSQEDRLQEFSKYLPEKEQRACKMLRESKVLSDAELEPLYRVALRQIKDYAKPFEVSIGEDKHIFCAL